MNTIVVSDLHIGSRFFARAAFEQFLRHLPSDCELVLNGDIIDNPRKQLPPSHRSILDRIENISVRQRVVWLRGNHDNGYLPGSFGDVVFQRSHFLGHRLWITHGDDFDEILPRNQLFMKAFKFMHEVRMRLGARPVHVAEYAKKWTLLYGVFCKNVLRNAVKCAVENGYEAVACGHTHCAEDAVFNGIRYINTGAWTAFPAFFLQVTEDRMRLQKVQEHTDPFCR